MTLPQFNQLPDASATQSPLNECDGTLWVISPKASVNLCANPSFETDTNNWTVDAGGTITRLADPWAGAYGLSWATVPGSYLRYGVLAQINMPRQRYYAVSFYCYSATANSDTTVTVEVYNTSLGTVLSSYTQKITTSWSRVVSVFYTFIISTNQFAVRISCNQSLTIVLDAVQIEQTNGATATTYFDGSTEPVISNSQITSPQYTWQGKAHASTSIRSVTAANGGLPINLQNELGFTVVGVIGADSPAPNNQIVSFNGTDGASLQDILIPPRQITFVGRISSTDKTSLARKVSTFLQYFGRDTTAIRQPKYFVFQFKNGRESIGQPMYFSGVVTNTPNIPVSNDLAYTVSITINMIDPFFYGHDDGVAQQMPSLNSTTGGLSYIPDFTQKTGAFTTFAQALGDVNGVVRTMVTAPDGTIYFGGDFTTVGGSGLVSYIGRLIIRPDSSTYLIEPLSGGALNGAVYALAISPDGADLWVGGTFTTANAVTTNRIAKYAIATNTWSTFGGGVGGGVNGAVYAITIRPRRLSVTGAGYAYQVFIGGAFTAATSGTLIYRVSVASQTASAWLQIGTGNGMNGDVLALAYNNNYERLYIGGAFTTSQAGAANAYTKICYINISAFATTVAFYTGMTGGEVYTIYTEDTDNALYIGGSFTGTFAGAPLNRVAQFNGVVWSQLDTGFSDGIVYGITPYRNGLSIIGTFINKDVYTLLNWGIVWYNGQVLLPVAVNATTKGFTAQTVSGDGTLYLGINYVADSIISSGLVIQKNYNGTAAASVVVQAYVDDVLFIGGVIFQVQNATQQTVISFKQMPMTYKEILQVDTKLGTIKSDIMGNQLRYLLGSGLTSLKVMPKNNYLVFWGLNNTAARAVYVSIYWRKTYDTLFDGINAT
jgi:hypothetical protein